MDRVSGRETTGARVVLFEVSKTYGRGKDEQITAADSISLELEGGATLAITGSSGSGKSTLLHLMGAIDRPDAGSITVDGVNIAKLGAKRLPGYRRSVGFVFQRYNLLPALTALDNVLAPVLPRRTEYNKTDRARELLAAVGLADRAKSMPSRLSGGQQQRVAIARALIGSPSLLLADEPTGNLDSRTGSDVLELILELGRTRGMTIVIATHDAGVAARCDRVVRLRDGSITETHDIEEMLASAPATRLTELG